NVFLQPVKNAIVVPHDIDLQSRVPNAAKRLEPSRINVMHSVHKIKPDSSGLVPRIYRRHRTRISAGRPSAHGSSDDPTAVDPRDKPEDDAALGAGALDDPKSAGAAPPPPHRRA
ncbi:hypothetical protein, partial [Jiella sonneratiae]